MDTKEVIEKTGIAKTTLFKYEDVFKIPVKRVNGERQWSEENLKLIEQIKNMRLSHGLNTIQRKLSDEGIHEPSMDTSDPYKSNNTTNHDTYTVHEQYTETQIKQAEIIAESFNEAVHSKLEKVQSTINRNMENQLASLVTPLLEDNKKLNSDLQTASHYIGQLEAKLESEQGKTRLISDGSIDTTRILKNELEKKEMILNELQKKLDKTQEDLLNEKSKSLWQRLFGK